MTAAELSMSVQNALLVLGAVLLALEAGKRIRRRLERVTSWPVRRHCWICRERLAGPWWDRYCPSSHRHIERLFR